MKTAVELAFEQLRHSFNTVGCSGTKLKLEIIEKQAKEKERQQIIDAYINGKYESDKIVMSDKFYAQQYYNEIFGKQDDKEAQQ